MTQGKDSPNEAQEPGKHIAAVEIILRAQHFNLSWRPVGVDHAGFGLHQPDQAGSGGEVLSELDVDVGLAI